MDAAQYDPDTIHVTLDGSKSFTGTPWAKTRQGRVSPSGTLVA